MHALALSLVLALGTVATADAAEAPAKPERHVDGDSGRAGLALLAGGAALATATAAGATLLEAMTTPDDGRNKPANPDLTQVSGFATIGVASVSIGMMLVGGALLLGDAAPVRHDP